MSINVSSSSINSSRRRSVPVEPTTWTQRTSSFGGGINNVAYGGGIWVAVGDSGTLATASDPTSTWTQRTSSFGADHVFGVAYVGGLWVAVGGVGKCATAPDPTSTWTQRTTGQGALNLTGVANDGSTTWTLCGDRQLPTVLPSGISWSTDPTAGFTRTPEGFFNMTFGFSIKFGGGNWVVCGSKAPGVGLIGTATDPTNTFVSRSNPFTQVIMDIAYGRNSWVGVSNGGELGTASDPTGLWTLRANPFGGTPIRGVGHFNGAWTSVGEGGKMATSIDITGTWTSRTSSFGATRINKVAYGNGFWVAVGESGKLATGV